MAINVLTLKKDKKTISYPKLMISERGQIVLALREKSDNLWSVVMLDDNGCNISNDYCEFFAGNLVDYDGEITISNKY